MGKLVDGIHTFHKEIFLPRQEEFALLAKEHKPNILFITCADSRIDPLMVTQANLGEIFIIRNAGNIIPPYEDESSEAASIEFAVKELGVKEIIVCGHLHCGAMNYLFSEEKKESLPALNQWLKHAKDVKWMVEKHYRDVPKEKMPFIQVEENVLVQIERLKTYPFINQGLEDEKLHLHAWVYDFTKGDVLAYDPDEKQFYSLVKGKDD